MPGRKLATGLPLSSGDLKCFCIPPPCEKWIWFLFVISWKFKWDFHWVCTHIGMANRTQNASGAPYFWVPCSHKCHCSLGLHGVKVRTMHFADFWSPKFSWKPQASNNYHMSWIICHTALISQRNTDLLVRWFVYKFLMVYVCLKFISFSLSLCFDAVSWNFEANSTKLDPPT